MVRPNPLLYTRPPSLTPPSKLPGRNEECWCGSGLKYKKCHLNRESAPEINILGKASKFAASAKRGRCLHPDAGGGVCSAKSIGSHTLQRGGGLKAIADDSHVLTTMLGFFDLKKAFGTPEPRRIGISDASTFPGFCNKHDTALFLPIEQPKLQLDEKTAFLTLYRALCLEFVRKRDVISTLPDLKLLDSGKSLPDQVQQQVMLAEYQKGLDLSMTALVSRKAAADAKLVASDWTDVQYCMLEFDSLLPAVSACAFYPEFNWNGRKLQNLADLTRDPLEMTMTLTSYGAKSCVIFAWVGPDNDCRREFVEGFMSIPDDEKAGRIVAACFELAENTYITPSWWAGLNADVRKHFSAKIWNGAAMTVHSGPAMADTAPLVVTPTVAGLVASWAPSP